MPELKGLPAKFSTSCMPIRTHRKVLRRTSPDAIRQGYGSGCYRLAFDQPHWFLRANCWFTRFNLNAVRFGDQSLFVKREIFEKAGQFREDLVVMEDQEIIGRIRRHTRFKVFPRSVTTSARKYRENGIYKLQGVFFLIYFMYQLGFSQEQLVRNLPEADQAGQGVTKNSEC
jgi:hypothetical protein